jgi:redox-sensing transcriptional repressor
MILPAGENEYISSSELAELVGLNPTRIRKDLSYFGDFGVRGVGYRVESLVEKIRSILKLSGGQKVAVVGAGRLGTAISAYPGFVIYGFEIAAVFDSSKSRVGKKIGTLVIEDSSKLVSSICKKGIKIGIIAVPAKAAQETADKLVEAGVKGIMNLSPCYLNLPGRVKVLRNDIAMELGALPYYM